MAASDNPEKLLADALRAQAAGSPSMPPVEAPFPPMPVLPLGNDTGPTDRFTSARGIGLPPPSLPAWVLLLFAVLLGLAAGAVIGVLTLW
ncbi:MULTISPECIES: hypothetical protein [unclassified Crossiella]|uniref:hypothetical protein n=1 Tax=unclassified Crossiella TaxID=2620835 RepID=UPI001FFF1019|nr:MULTISPECIES: hypothetical protein [unclassified Crossiella]MCK2236382.1 hypothetical protein [Crossiella sp. S99.2]MCK2250049.1 hypothetical protein [Crossiella sp. S99.1]